MEITDVTTYALSYRVEDNPPRTRSFVLVKLDTSEGISGWGEASDCYGHTNPGAIRALFDETLKWLLLGQDPLRGDLTSIIRRRIYPTLGQRGLVMEAVSAFDIALWDIRGREAGKPVSELLGKNRSEIDIYAAGKPEFTLSGADYVHEMFDHLLERGARAVKVRPGKSIEWDTQFLHEVRETVPAGVDVLVDGKYNYTFEGAVRIGKVLEEIGAFFFEEPIVGGNLDLIGRLSERLNVPLAYGEDCFTLDDFRDAILRGGTRFAEPDSTICGGITEMTRIGALCEGLGVEVIPHCGGLTAVGLSANLQAAAALPSCPLFEFDARTYQPLRDRLVEGDPFEVKDGRVAVPTGPGLGVDIITDVFDEYPFAIDERIARNFPWYGTQHVR